MLGNLGELLLEFAATEDFSGDCLQARFILVTWWG